MPQTVNQVVEVIIPTLALAQRSVLIRRAIESVTSQQNVRAVPLVVINGDKAHRQLVKELEARSDLRVLQLAEPNIPAALLAGRRAVESPWFAQLDDDDVLSPQALSLRLQLLRENDEIDAVITNGTICSARGENPSPAIDDAALVSADPLSALVEGNWLNPGAALFRSSSVPASLFEGMPKFLEWTYLAVRLAQQHRLAFLDVPTYTHYTDTPLSTWASEACTRGLPAAFDRLLELDLPPALRNRFAQRLTAAAHGVAHLDLSVGRLLPAWRWHLQCLRGVDGWRFSPFTYRLLLGHFRAWGRPA